MTADTRIVLIVGLAIIILLLITAIACSWRAHRTLTRRNDQRANKPRGKTRQSEW